MALEWLQIEMALVDVPLQLAFLPEAAQALLAFVLRKLRLQIIDHGVDVQRLFPRLHTRYILLINISASLLC